MQSGVQILDFNVGEFRAQIRKMSDEKLREFGEAARYLYSPRAGQAAVAGLYDPA